MSATTLPIKDLKRVKEMVQEGVDLLAISNATHFALDDEAKAWVTSQIAPVATKPEPTEPAPTRETASRVRQPEGFRALAERAFQKRQARVLPIAVGGKQPLTKWKDSEVDALPLNEWLAVALDYIEDWAIKFPDANCCEIAKANERCFIDEDLDEFRTGFEKWSGIPFPLTFTTSARAGHRQSHWLQTDRTRALGNVGQDSLVVASVRQNNLYVLSEGSQYKDGLNYYDVVDSSPVVPMPDKLVEYIEHLIALQDAKKVKPESTSTISTSTVDLDSPFIRGTLHPRIISLAGYYIQNKNISDADELYALVTARMEKNGVYQADGSTPFAYDTKEVRKKCENAVASWDTGEERRKKSEIILNQVPTDTFFRFPAVVGNHRDYVVNPGMGQKDGWFPLGSVSMIGGSSGSNKTTWALDLLHCQFKGVDVWGHTTNKRPYLVFMFDRGKGAHLRTLERLSLAVGDIPTKFLPPVTDEIALKAILDHIEDGDIPEVVFIEGADMLVADANKGAFVVSFMSGLQRIAEHYHIAIILSVGAPKTRIGEGYIAKRDSMLGSEKWTRMSETVVAMQFVEGDDTDRRRACFVLLRNGPAEKFNLTLSGGKLVTDTAPRTEKPTSEGQAILAKNWYLALFADGKGGWKESVTLDEHRRAIQTTSFPEYALKSARRSLGIYYDQQKRVYEFASDPNGERVSLEPESEPEKAKTL